MVSKYLCFFTKINNAKLYDSLQELGVNFLKKSVKIDEPEKKQLILQDQSRISYEKYINCAGPGALDMAKSVSDNFDNLTILPFWVNMRFKSLV